MLTLSFPEPQETSSGCKIQIYVHYIEFSCILVTKKWEYFFPGSLRFVLLLHFYILSLIHRGGKRCNRTVYSQKQEKRKRVWKLFINSGEMQENCDPGRKPGAVYENESPGKIIRGLTSTVCIFGWDGGAVEDVLIGSDSEPGGNLSITRQPCPKNIPCFIICLTLNKTVSYKMNTVPYWS